MPPATEPSLPVLSPEHSMHTSGRAVQLIKQNGATFELCPEAIQVLHGLGNEKLAVVSIAGTTRQGKSYIMNKLANAEGGLKVSSQPEPCTHGIWLWSQPVTINGKQHKLVFLDTEGVASSEQSPEAEAALVSLAGVVSCTMIYNKTGAFNEQCIATLSQVAATLKKVFGISEDNSVPGRSIETSPPALLVLFRDSDMLEEDVSEVLEKQLEEQDYSGWNVQAVRDKNAARALIKDVFSVRYCHALPYPGGDASKLEQSPATAERARFFKAVEALKVLIYTSSEPKAFNGVPMTGPIMVQLLQAAVAAANAGKGPTLANMWDAIQELELKEASKAAEEAYKAAAGMLDSWVSVSACKKVHEAAVETAQKCHNKRITVASVDKQVDRWCQLVKQFQPNLTSAVERIKRQRAEEEADFGKMLQEAKAAATRCFDKDAFTAAVLQQKSDPASIFAKHNTAARQAFALGKNAWDKKNPHATIPKRSFLVESAEQEVVSVLLGYQELALETLKVVRAEEAAQQAAAEQKRLAEESKARVLQQALLQDAMTKYKRQMTLFAMSCSDEQSLEQKHEDVLAGLLRPQPTTLPLSNLKEYAEQVEDRCKELKASYIAQVKLHKMQKQKAAFEAATTEAMKMYRQMVGSIDSTSTDKAKVMTAYQDAEDRVGHVITRLGQLRIQGDLPDWAGCFEETMHIMGAEIQRTKCTVLQRVQANIAAAQALRKQQEAAAAAIRKQQEAAAAAAAEQLRLQQQQIEAERKRQQALARQRQEEAERVRRAQEAEQQRQEQEYREWQRQQAALHEAECRKLAMCVERQHRRQSTRCHNQLYSTSRDDDEDNHCHDSSSGRRHSGHIRLNKVYYGSKGNSYTLSSRGIPIATRDNKECDNCVNGKRCPHHDGHLS